jgi:hypothetical protein
MSNLITQIIVYSIIIILIPIFLDILFRITIRRKRKTSLLHKAIQRSKETKKPLLIFNNPNDGYLKNISGDTIKLDTNITETIKSLKDDYCVILISETLEYVNNPNELIKELKRVSNDDIYVNNFEKKSLRFYFDNNIINIMDKPYYMGTNCNEHSINWSKPSKFMKKSSNFYSVIMNFLPRKFIFDDPIYKPNK